MFDIEKNVPIPAARGGARLSKFPLTKMEVGDSFLIPLVKRIIRGKQKMTPQVGINIKAANEAYKPKVFRKVRAEDGLRVFRVE